MASTEQFTVRILEREYRLSCSPDEKAALMAAVAHVDQQMQTIRDQGRITNAERIAVFAALSIASELLARGPLGSTAEGRPVPGVQQREVEVADPEIARRMRSLNALLDSGLANQEQLF